MGIGLLTKIESSAPSHHPKQSFMNTQANRECPFCAEIIKSEARLCPHCRQWLSLRSWRNPKVSFFAFGFPVLLLWVFGAVFFLKKLDQIQNPKPNFSEFRKPIKLRESRMNPVQTKDGLRLYLTGLVTNESPIAWRDLEFECRFYDSKGVMIDASTAGSAFTIGANDERAFRISVTPPAPTNDYVSFKLAISTARNTKGWF
jgi:hypothetical protein